MWNAWNSAYSKNLRFHSQSLINFQCRIFILEWSVRVCQLNLSLAIVDFIAVLYWQSEDLISDSMALKILVLKCLLGKFEPRMDCSQLNNEDCDLCRLRTGLGWRGISPGDTRIPCPELSTYTVRELESFRDCIWASTQESYILAVSFHPITLASSWVIFCFIVYVSAGLSFFTTHKSEEESQCAVGLVCPLLLSRIYLLNFKCINFFL